MGLDLTLQLYMQINLISVHKEQIMVFLPEFTNVSDDNVCVCVGTSKRERDRKWGSIVRRDRINEWMNYE